MEFFQIQMSTDKRDVLHSQVTMLAFDQSLLYNSVDSAFLKRAMLAHSLSYVFTKEGDL